MKIVTSIGNLYKFMRKCNPRSEINGTFSQTRNSSRLMTDSSLTNTYSTLNEIIGICPACIRQTTFDDIKFRNFFTSYSQMSKSKKPKLSNLHKKKYASKQRETLLGRDDTFSPDCEKSYLVKAYATSQALNLDSLQEDLKQQGLYVPVPLPQDCKGVLYTESVYKISNEPREILFFRILVVLDSISQNLLQLYLQMHLYGTVVFWNVPDFEQQSVLKDIKKHEILPHGEELKDDDHIVYSFTKSITKPVGDHFQLQLPRLRGKKQHQLEKYTISDALSSSVQLAVYETTISHEVDPMQNVLEDIRIGKNLKTTHKEVLKILSNFYKLGDVTDLLFELQDSPDFYWDRSSLYKLYTESSVEFSIRRRVSAINNRLQYCNSLADSVRQQLSDRHHTISEILIIALIAIEVVIGLAHYKHNNGPL